MPGSNNLNELPLVDLEVSLESAKQGLQTNEVQEVLDGLEKVKEVSYETLLFVFNV